MNQATTNESLATNVRRHAAPDRAAVAESTTSRRSLGRVYVVLPTYNEEQNLEALLRRIHAALDPLNCFYEVLVVNDGSRDRTLEIARAMSESMPIQLVNHVKNQGLGGTLRTGFTTAVQQANPNDVIVTMDADNTQPPESIPQMVDMIRNGYDLVVASRFQPGAQVVGVPMVRRWMSEGARWVFALTHPIRGIRDYTCGFRAYRASVLQRGMEEYGQNFVSERGFASMSDILLKLRRQKLVAGEIPLILRYDQKGGASKMKVFKTVCSTLWLVTRRRIKR
jgi:dolichol-phosphate mannosyltransferase